MSLLVATEFFNIAVNNFDAKNYASCNEVFIVTEIVINGAQCSSVVRVWVS